jgi:hypothetical protein
MSVNFYQTIIKYENTDVSRSISVLVLRVLKWLKFPTVSYIYLLRPRVHQHRIPGPA